MTTDFKETSKLYQKLVSKWERQNEATTTADVAPSAGKMSEKDDTDFDWESLLDFLIELDPNLLSIDALEDLQTVLAAVENDAETNEGTFYSKGSSAEKRIYQRKKYHMRDKNKLKALRKSISKIAADKKRERFKERNAKMRKTATGRIKRKYKNVDGHLDEQDKGQYYEFLEENKCL